MTVHDKLQIYENRAELYVALFDDIHHTFHLIREAIHEWLVAHDASAALRDRVDVMLALDKALCPRKGNPSVEIHQFDADAPAIIRALEAMDLPPTAAFDGSSALRVNYPGGVGTVLKDPDGGSWMRGDWSLVAEFSREMAAESVVNVVLNG
jgi:hypothetical protein